MLGLLAVWPERLGAGSVGGAGWAALFYCHFLAVPLSLPLSRLSVLSLPSPGRRWLWGLAGWGIASAGAAWCPSVLMLALVAVLASLGAGAGRCPLLALRPFLSWVLALGSGAAVSLCPLSWVLAFLCCPLVLACYALGLGAGLGWGRCRGCPGRGGGGWLGLVCADLAGC